MPPKLSRKTSSDHPASTVHKSGPHQQEASGRLGLHKVQAKEPNPVNIETTSASSEQGLNKRSVQQPPLPPVTEADKTENEKWLAQDGEGDTLAHRAARKGDIDTLKEILTDRCGIHSLFIENEYGNTPIQEALYEGKKEWVWFFIQHCPENLVLVDEDGSSNNIFNRLAHFATQKNNTTLLEWLLERRKESLYMGDARKITPVHAAVEFESIDCLKLLLKHNPESLLNQDEDGRTPLYDALFYQNKEALKVMLVQPTFVQALEIKSNEGTHPLRVKTSAEIREILEQPQQDEQGNTLAHRAAESGNLSQLQGLLPPYGIGTLTLKNNTGYCPLYLAIATKHIDCSRLIIKLFPDSLLIQDNNGSTPTHAAAFHDNEDFLDFLFETVQGVESLNYRDVKNNTPLHIAAHRNNYKFIEVVANKAKIKPFIQERLQDQNARGDTPLHGATHQRKPDAILILTQLQPKAILIQNNQGLTPVHYMAQENLTNTIEVILQQPEARDEFQEALTKQDNDGYTPLHLAVRSGHTEAIKILANAQPESLTIGECSYKRTPIHLAAMKSDSQYLEAMLTQIKANPALLKAADTDGHTPLHSAVDTNKLKCAKLLISEHNDNLLITDNRQQNPVHLSAFHGFLDCLKTLLSTTDKQPNMQKSALAQIDSYGNAPIHWAIHGAHIDCVQYLLTHSKDAFSTQTSNGNSAIDDIAIQITDSSDLRKLLSALPIETVLIPSDKDGVNPMHVAANHGNLNFLKISLEEKKISPEAVKKTLTAQTINGETALHFSVKNGHNNCVKYLTQASPKSILVPDKNKNTPVHVAIDGDDEKILSNLLETSEGIKALLFTNAEGNTPLHIAAHKGKKNHVELLIKKEETQILNVNNENLTPAHLAARYGHSECLKAMLRKSSIKNNSKFTNELAFFSRHLPNSSRIIEMSIKMRSQTDSNLEEDENTQTIINKSPDRTAKITNWVDYGDSKLWSFYFNDTTEKMLLIMKQKSFNPENLKQNFSDDEHRRSWLEITKKNGGTDPHSTSSILNAPVDSPGNFLIRFSEMSRFNIASIRKGVENAKKLGFGVRISHEKWARTPFSRSGRYGRNGYLEKVTGLLESKSCHWNKITFSGYCQLKAWGFNLIEIDETYYKENPEKLIPWNQKSSSTRPLVIKSTLEGIETG